jgi:hypothetical protein
MRVGVTPCIYIYIRATYSCSWNRREGKGGKGNEGKVRETCPCSDTDAPLSMLAAEFACAPSEEWNGPEGWTRIAYSQQGAAACCDGPSSYLARPHPAGDYAPCRLADPHPLKHPAVPPCTLLMSLLGVTARPACSRQRELGWWWETRWRRR